jgi:hypothetical protein
LFLLIYLPLRFDNTYSICFLLFGKIKSIPHSNSYRHDGTILRVVVYCSFLPDVPINRIYVKNQLEHWKCGRYPSGNQWIKNNRQTNNVTVTTRHTNINKTTDNQMKNDGDDDERNDEINNRNQYRILATSCTANINNETTISHIGDTKDETYDQNCLAISQLLSTPLARKLAGWDDWD